VSGVRDSDPGVATYLMRIRVSKVRSRAVLPVVAGAAAAFVAAPSVVPAAPTASRIVDRTVVCRMLGSGFPDAVRFLRSTATPDLPESNAPPSANITNGDESVAPVVGAGLRSGRGTAAITGEARISEQRGTRCTRAKLRIPLSTRGLVGGAAGEIGTSYRCTVPAKVIIRVRAVFTRPTTVRFDARFGQVVARGDIAIGYVAAATFRGRTPIVLASVNGARGTASIFAAAGCQRS
jgi:hypothetical protein